MRTLEVFFDYTCPFCKTGHEFLKASIGNRPDMQIKWCPCEAHPEPEPGPHSDLLMQAALFAVSAGADMMAFHDAMYDAVLTKRINIRDVEEICAAAAGAVDPAALNEALKGGRYSKALLDMNDYAYEQSGVWTIPAYRMDGKKLDAVAGVGITLGKLEAFLNGQ